jgi:Ca2+-binding RTX toxin-like protein
MTGRTRILCLFAAVATVAIPGSVGAAAIVPDFNVTDGSGGKLLVKGTGVNNALTVFYGTETGQGKFQVAAENGQTITESSSHCVPSQFFPNQIVFCDYDVSRFVLKQGAGNDKNFMSKDGSDAPWPAAVTLSVNGGPDDDRVRGAEGDDVIKGSTGKDKMVGGDGSDRLLARDGTEDRSINCGAGNDPDAKLDPFDPHPRSC